MEDFDTFDGAKPRFLNRGKKRRSVSTLSIPQALDRRVEWVDFGTLLSKSVRIHGHLCPGQVLGVRMSILGLKEIGVENTNGKNRKHLIVFVEMDRCATDAVQSITGCSLGKRTMKFMDYGKMAATFLNLNTGKAVRIVAKEEARERAKEYFPEIEDKYLSQIEAYKIMSDQELFDMMEVSIELKPEDMPGRPLKRIKCDLCGEYVQDMREVQREGKILCKPCVEGSYYTVQIYNMVDLKEIENTDRDKWKSHIRSWKEVSP